MERTKTMPLDSALPVHLSAGRHARSGAIVHLVYVDVWEVARSMRNGDEVNALVRAP